MDYETKHYSDGTSAFGIAPLPPVSPDQQDAGLFLCPICCCTVSDCVDGQCGASESMPNGTH